MGETVLVPPVVNSESLRGDTSNCRTHVGAAIDPDNFDLAESIDDRHI